MIDLDEVLARCRFPSRGTPVTAAVSGGPDSLALLVLAIRAGCVVTAVHVDHGLRAGSADEAKVVADAASRLGAGFRAESAAVVPGGNVEARARTARYSVLPIDVLTGHTADDRAETILLNLMRGAGLEGLSALRSDWRHPLLALRRADTEAVCETLGLEPVRDPSNRDPGFRRNRVRHELLTLMADIAARDPVPLLCRQADLLAEDADLLSAWAAQLDPTDAAALAAAPAALARRAVRRWLRATSADGQPPDAATVERVMAVARQESVAAEVGGGRRVARTAGCLRLEPPPG